jgi:predicted O-methyltransferase YrrM
MSERAEGFPLDDPVLLHTMSWARELGIAAVEAQTGAILRLLAATARAKTVVEIGTGTGVSGLWLLGGMRRDGVLTSIDVEPELQKLARQAFAAAGFAPSRFRLISGQAHDVLPRLADGAYDVVFVDGEVEDYPRCVSAAYRLLRADGLLVVNNALSPDSDMPERDTVTLRELVGYVHYAPEWLPTLLAAGTGLLCAIKRDPVQ